MPESEWRVHMSEQMKQYFREAESSNLKEQQTSEVKRLLAIAADELEECSEDLALRCVIIRKERAVGLVPGGPEGRKKKPTGSGTTRLKPEVLEEVCYRVRQAIRMAGETQNTSAGVCFRITVTWLTLLQNRPSLL